MSKPTERATEMRRMLQEFHASGLTRREFCLKHNISVTTLDYWRRQLRTKPLKTVPRLVKVEVAQSPAASFTLRLTNGRAIESSFPLAEQDLARLIRIAEQA